MRVTVQVALDPCCMGRFAGRLVAHVPFGAQIGPMEHMQMSGHAPLSLGPLIRVCCLCFAVCCWLYLETAM